MKKFALVLVFAVLTPTTTFADSPKFRNRDFFAVAMMPTSPVKFEAGPCWASSNNYGAVIILEIASGESLRLKHVALLQSGRKANETWSSARIDGVYEVSAIEGDFIRQQCSEAFLKSEDFWKLPADEQARVSDYLWPANPDPTN